MRFIKENKTDIFKGVDVKQNASAIIKIAKPHGYFLIVNFRPVFQ